MLTRGSGRRVALTLATLITVGMLTACSGDEEVPAAWPTMAQPTATALSPTPTPTPDPRPSLPPAAKEGTPAGAEEFVRYFLKAYEYAYATNDTSPVEYFTLRGCRFCEGLLDAVRQQAAKGYRLEGGRLKPLYITVNPDSDQDRTIINAAFSEESSRMVDSSGRVVQSFTSSRAQLLDIALRWNLLNGWRVIDASIEDGPQ
jgi:hypothetical protein